MARLNARRPLEARAIRSGSPKLSVTYRRIADLQLDPRNPRIHSRGQLRKLALSIQKFGFNSPVLIDAHLRVLAGHGRILACKELGWSEVPTIMLEHLSEAQARGYMIADNRLTEIASWDEVLLAEHLKTLSGMDLTFPLEAVGFEMGEIDLLIQGSSKPPEDERADAAPPQRGPQVTQPGDLWELGPHRVYCGNCLEGASYITLLKGKVAAMVFIDPPYNVKINGHASGLGRHKHRDFPMASGELNQKEFTQFLTNACALLVRYSASGSIHYICIDWRHVDELLNAGRQEYSELKNICVWVKNNAGMGSFYRSRHELIFVYKSGRSAHRNNVRLGMFGRDRSNVWEYPSASTASRAGEDGNLLALHPTVKPVRMVQDAILDCTARGDIVLDTFLGSGTTVIAAERSGRVCCGMELDPQYVDTTVRRWQSYTGGQARHAESGRIFGESAARRGRKHA